jgi:tetratricopeptide (TPR) repeat protein
MNEARRTQLNHSEKSRSSLPAGDSALLISPVSPADLGKKLQKARISLESGNFADALSLYAGLVKEFPRGAGEYGSAAAQSGDFELADRIWEKLRSQESKNAEVIAKLAWLLARTNSVEEARPAVNRCLELDPQNAQARYLAAHLDRRENKLPEAEKQLRDLIASGLKLQHVRYACHSELANILDRTERFDEAMAFLEEGKKIARQAFNLQAERKSFYEGHEKEVRQAKSLPEDILDKWSKTFPPRARNTLPAVAFLSGASRSGTTLLERVLDAHPSVAACDEPPVFKRIQARIDVAAPSIPAQRLNVLRELYVKSMATILGTPVQGKILLDKNPSRTVWLPAFLRAFPDLRVLIALRDPRDVMISLYFQDHPNTNYLTFEQLAQHYVSVMDVWLAVRRWKGLNWLETRYEDVVADLHKEGGRVTKFLGLEWHENQSRYFERNREKPILSTNYTDVTKPVYKRSVGRWRVYEKQLTPVLPMLAPYLKEFGYE